MKCNKCGKKILSSDVYMFSHADGVYCIDCALTKIKIQKAEHVLGNSNNKDKYKDRFRYVVLYCINEGIYNPRNWVKLLIENKIPYIGDDTAYYEGFCEEFATEIYELIEKKPTPPNIAKLYEWARVGYETKNYFKLYKKINSKRSKG